MSDEIRPRPGALPPELEMLVRNGSMSRATADDLNQWVEELLCRVSAGEMTVDELMRAVLLRATREGTLAALKGEN
jgi:hypothetical protein